MKALPHCARPVCQSLLETLRHIVGVNVVDGLEAEVRERQFVPAREFSEDLRVEVSRRIERRPTRPDDVTRMQNGRRAAASVVGVSVA